jgi:hypothetical protein
MDLVVNTDWAVVRVAKHRMGWWIVVALQMFEAHMKTWRTENT